VLRDDSPRPRSPARGSCSRVDGKTGTNRVRGRESSWGFAAGQVRPRSTGGAADDGWRLKGWGHEHGLPRVHPGSPRGIENHRVRGESYRARFRSQSINEWQWGVTAGYAECVNGSNFMPTVHVTGARVKRPNGEKQLTNQGL
jgi:hypothetical protein